jgi:hypothetical protein
MSGHDPPMAAKLVYQMFTKLLSWTVLHTRSYTANEIKILVLRHQLAVLQRRTPRPARQLHGRGRRLLRQRVEQINAALEGSIMNVLSNVSTPQVHSLRQEFRAS